MDELQQYLMTFDDDYEETQEWIVYAVIDDRAIAIKPTIEEAQQFARDWLARRFGGYEFDYENSAQWVHAKSPNAGKPGASLVDVIVYEASDTR